MAKSKKLSASLENYLETILWLEREGRVARAGEIAQVLKVKTPSVTKALGLLAEKKLINYVPYGLITLTAVGKRTAEGVEKRHEVLKKFLSEILCVDSEEAESTACKMEHFISGNVLDRLTRYLDYLGNCPRGAVKWADGSGFVCRSTEKEDDSSMCRE